MAPVYQASKSRSQRQGWSALFRHPLRVGKDGNPLRVRKGLGTRDDAEADQLISQLNRLLGEKSFWTVSAKAQAAREMDSRVIKIFYEDIEVRIEDPWARREENIPLPGSDQGYSRVQFVGTTGAGKTTLLRQLIGSDPKEDRFPSTSTAKTTVFDTEIICAEGPYQAAVSFLSRERVRFYIEECVVAGVSAAAEGEPENKVLRHLLEHSDQRFRLSYILGNLRATAQEEDTDDLFDEDSETDTDSESEIAEIGLEERRSLEARLKDFLKRTIQLAGAVSSKCAKELEVQVEGLKPDERDAFLDLVEQSLRDDEEAQSLIDDILEDVESRFQLLEGIGNAVDETWPEIWTFESNDRSEFIKTINRFSSNYAPNFGRLLTPLVQGLRVSGPFKPIWDPEGEVPKLVLIDGEGLGHTPDSAFSLPTSITRRYELVDVILLVDNATQPMQAGAQAVLRSLAVSGHGSKLAIVFTHFDQVKGDNLPDQESKKNHVFSSLDGAINGLESVLGTGISKVLNRYLDGRVFFAARIQEKLSSGARFTLKELTGLLEMLTAASEPMEILESTAIYDLGNLVLGVRKATEQFNEYWRARLNLIPKSGVRAEHWTRIKALSRRFASQWDDHYANLTPVADLISFLSEHLNGFIVKPRGWKPSVPVEEARQQAVDRVAQEFFTRLHSLANRRLFIDHVAEWAGAYRHAGTGSTRLRARDIRDLYEDAAPIPGEVPEQESTDLLDGIRSMFKEAAEIAGAEVI